MCNSNASMPGLQRHGSRLTAELTVWVEQMPGFKGPLILRQNEQPLLFAIWHCKSVSHCNNTRALRTVVHSKLLQFLAEQPADLSYLPTKSAAPTRGEIICTH